MEEHSRSGCTLFQLKHFLSASPNPWTCSRKLTVEMLLQQSESLHSDLCVNTDRQMANQGKVPVAEPGDKLERSDGLISHWGLYTGGSVIHKGPANQETSSKIATGKTVPGMVKEDTYEIFSKGQKVKVHKSTLPSGENIKAVTEARKQIGSTTYNLFEDNCEHFVTSVVGERRSTQVENFERVTENINEYLKENQNF
ncbi:phospholipase A and acyltransferase 2-like [Scyliorhinus torazame]|uniref:phospholipase A and acyltransferase 2-like n=1 Tax=Scyliorhinus torazame TaxID=75743 RepID=UPI003B5ABABF